MLGSCLVVVVAVALSPASSSELHQPQWEVLEQRPGQGEQCLVCRKRVYDQDVVEIRYQGRTFHVGLPFLGDFENDPEHYFARLQARSALFDESALVGRRSMAFGWLWLGVYVLAGLVCSALCGYIAVGKALTPLPWFFAGLAGNLAGLGRGGTSWRHPGGGSRPFMEPSHRGREKRRRGRVAGGHQDARAR